MTLDEARSKNLIVSRPAWGDFYFILSRQGRVQRSGIVTDASVTVGEDIGFFGPHAVTVRRKQVVFARSQ